MAVGLLTEGINEVIATTDHNAAPMGIINRNGSLHMVLFRGSHTARNIARDRRVVANFVFDPVIYVKTAFGDLPFDAFVSEDIDGTAVFRLRDAEAWAAFAADVERSGDESIVVRLSPLKEEVLGLRLHPVNRGFASIVEATVHATRYVRNRDPWLGRLIEHHSGLARKCGGAREREALELLEGYIADLTRE
ncbi:protein of unknown function DUF447 [Methanoculleus marisnigri JR1]|uniref:DUF447 family protein n=1 Tax=Methanoculleus marisnigri (strain ATCC 35101 / DSM 1498 / JR1) TaxID=368407 RepID=A3CWA4_METMJ|nr:DUF447 domain-containing protein [Methanoculleus submarinus]ABN57654.1 protein of unknown function DUF447 [Methanoculleus marisnigri JR1]